MNFLVVANVTEPGTKRWVYFTGFMRLDHVPRRVGFFADGEEGQGKGGFFSLEVENDVGLDLLPQEGQEPDEIVHGILFVKDVPAHSKKPDEKLFKALSEKAGWDRGEGRLDPRSLTLEHMQKVAGLATL